VSEGLTPNLLWVSLVAAAVGFLIISRILSYGKALIVACVKVSIPLIYFSWFFDGTWTFLDDMTYLDIGERMLQWGYNPLTVFTDKAAYDHLQMYAGGHHILYPWWNMLAEYLFGNYYYAPVFLNVALTFVCAYFMFRLATICGFKSNYARALMLFFLLHPEVLAWSSVLNLKDVMVMTLTIILLYLIIGLSNRFTVSGLCLATGILFLFYWIRFYVPFILTSATIIWLVFRYSRRRKFIFTALILICSYWLWDNFNIASHGERMGRMIAEESKVYNFIHIVLTPQPWSIDPNYSFLFVPSILHWVLFVPAVIAGIHIWRRFKNASLPLIYLIMGLLFYSTIPELGGPRHRFQLMFIVAWLQFHFFWIWLVNRDPGQNVLQDEKGI
jgi:hypothetical protein